VSLKLLGFCVRSLYREYGVAFLFRVMLAHPIATLRGIACYSRATTRSPSSWPGGPTSLVGVGFCLKPLSPGCPSGRANHNCRYFESGPRQTPEPCRGCLIRTIGEQSLACGSTLYVMTSARDILRDVLLPALEQRRFHSAVLAICRYSFEPVSLALAICGVDVHLVPFLEGDCREYASWRRADMGEKPERTVLDPAGIAELMETLSGAAQGARAQGFRKAKNLYEPVSS
jgi:hypothetical protein